MASAITSAFSFNAEELKDWSKVIHEMTYADPELNKLHQIDEGIAHNTQIVFAGGLGLMGKAVSGCTPAEIAGISLTEKFWTPIREDFRLKHCSADVNAQDKLINQFAKMNPDFYNVIEGSASTLGNFLVASVVSGFNEELMRKVWFNDILADTIANGGVLTNGTDKDYFNTFDGFWKQIVALGAPEVVITKNAGATYAAQELAAGESIAILKGLNNAADSRLKNDPNRQFYVTNTIFEGYLNDLEDNQVSGAGNTMITENGQTTLKYRGIEVVNCDFIDRYIDAYENDGTKRNLPHRAVLSTPQNLRVGTLAAGDFGEVDAFYDRTLKSNFIDGVYSVDAKHLEDYKLVSAR